MAMNIIVTEIWITTALQRKVTSAVNRFYKNGDDIFVYREKEDKWTGTYRIKYFRNKPQWSQSEIIPNNLMLVKLIHTFKIFLKNLTPSKYYTMSLAILNKEMKKNPLLKAFINEVIHSSDPRYS